MVNDRHDDVVTLLVFLEGTSQRFDSSNVSAAGCCVLQW